MGFLGSAEAEAEDAAVLVVEDPGVLNWVVRRGGDFLLSSSSTEVQGS